MTTSNGPLSLDAMFAAEASGHGIATPQGHDPHATSPDDFATPASSDSPEDPVDVEHEDEEDDIERDVPERDPENPEDRDSHDDDLHDDRPDDQEDGQHRGPRDSEEPGTGRSTAPAPQEHRGDRGEGSESTEAADPGELTFADLGLPGDLLKAVTDMGYTTPTAIQREAIPVLLGGRDVVGVAQTGTGKTAAFGLPLLDTVEARDARVQALVLAPTRELALQSAEALTDMAARSRGLDVVAVYGGAPYGPQIGALKDGAQVVVGTPGRVIDLIEKGALLLEDVRYFVLDEADEMLRMGFAEDVETIASSLPSQRRTALFSATMPPAIQEVARQHLHEPVQVEVSRPASTVATVRQTYAVVPFRHKIGAVSRVLAVTEAQAAIVFVRTKSTAEDVAIELAGRGIQAAAISGDVPQRERERLVERLRSGTLDVLVATDVAARGLDVDRIGLVVNFDVPREAEAYVHRIGRTGRAGRHGEAVTFLTPKEKRKLRQIERLTGTRLEEITLPSPADVSEHRARTLLERARSRHQRGRLDAYLPLVASTAEDLGTTTQELAATLVALAVGDEGPARRDDGDRGSPSHRATRGSREESLDSDGAFVSASFEGGRDDRHRRDRSDTRRGATRGGRREPEGPGTVYRLEVGHRDRVMPGAIVGALANEGGIDGSAIGKIDILQSFSLVTVHTELTPDQLDVIGRATVSGRELRIRPDEGPGHGWSGPGSREGRRGFGRDGQSGRGSRGWDRDERPRRRWEDRDREGRRGFGRDGQSGRGSRGWDRDERPRRRWEDRDRGYRSGRDDRGSSRFGGNRGGGYRGNRDAR
ncbi:DEAD/DEAH box helicase [Actinomyces sp. 2119]|uniref:DEAD/DEAH box helicase n=1 Tax=Actinomyces sp. 2119 TaxID=2321393 RepID=UPI000E6B7BBD|nr:DEAD/DEAH box helicase [Actinomyces sp. 2119]RJF44718.1 DEAD/DEAH box helicase [Actinomyces sp. 2119]